MKFLAKRIILIVLLVAAICLNVPSIAFAQLAVNPVGRIDKIGSHILQVITSDQLPPGVIPREFETRKEAEAYLDHIDADIAEQNAASALAAKDGLLQSQKGAIPSENAETFAASAAATTTSKYKDFPQCAGIHKVRVRSSFTYIVNTSGIKLIQSVSSVTSENLGYTVDSKWSQSSYTKKTIDSGRTLALNVYGVMKHYLLIKGVLEITSDELHLYAEFHP